MFFWAIFFMTLGVVGYTVHAWRITKKWRHKFVESLSDETLYFWSSMPFAVLMLPFCFVAAQYYLIWLILTIIQTGFLIWQILCAVLLGRRKSRSKEVGGGMSSFTINYKEQKNG